jgi:acyl-[acyl-carrier-protein]-phospholipid O-acyltransferase/long-chain-fatty-acid--[acyl-carrier-protein] ligase
VRSDLLAHFRKTGRPEVATPAVVLPVDALPLLATGKIDYPKAKEMAVAAAGPVVAVAE